MSVATATEPEHSLAAQEEYVRAESVRMLYAHLPPLLLASVLIACVMVYALWEVVDHARLLSWLIALLLISALRLAMHQVFTRRMRRPRHARFDSRLHARADTRDARVDDPRWGRYFVVGSFTAGILWALAGVALVPDGRLDYLLFVLFVLAGLGAGAISSLTAYLPAFNVFLPTMMIPAGLNLLLRGDPVHLALGVMAVLYVLSLSFFARNINASLRNTLELRYTNSALVRQLREQKEEAEQANISKSRFLAAASHDLRQPLHALSLFTSALQERTLPAREREIVNSIGTSVTALESLFNAILDISKLDAGVLEPEPVHFPIGDLLGRLRNDYTAEAQAKGLRLRVVPSTQVVYSDEVMLERVLRNLLSNAIHYTDRGGVVVGCRRAGKQVRLLVCDSGCGIPEESCEAIFQEFVQLGNPERDRDKGLGLGLAIVRRTAQLLGYTVQVRTRSGQGSCFELRVPGGNNQDVREDAITGQPARWDAETLCVLVVDDEAAAREGMLALLGGWGHEVRVAASADEACALIRDEAYRPDVVLADYRLRDTRTGVEAVHDIEAALAETVPALIITGDTAPDRLREAEASGYRLLHKPVKAASLRAYLRQVHKLGRRKDAG